MINKEKKWNGLNNFELDRWIVDNLLKKVLGENVAKTLDDISDTLKTLIAECNTKIEDYTDLYNDALKQEQRKKKKEGGLFTWI